ncbi:Uncharacterized protein dnm_026460 [Desulfonema magnum]|uniref:Uncharacterized protein n=1 Tax=Desulfonema magnum TaxID=45655 RepID=A0A975GMB1_9BACT|nr:Uncharacterized protein dnm_026460 [Desulfonema magnum]
MKKIFMGCYAGREASCCIPTQSVGTRNENLRNQKNKIGFEF